MPLRRGIFVFTAGPNTALIKSSSRRRDVRITIGGRMLALPVLERVDALSLELRTITVHTKHGLTVNGVAVDVTSACQVKIQGWSTKHDATAHEGSSKHEDDLIIDTSAVKLAAQHFLGKTDSEIEDSIQKTVSGHQRAIIGVLTVEELYRDRAAFSKRVLDLCSRDMRNMGLTVVSYTLAEITDVNGYIDALGITQTETVKREAKEGAALHQAASKIKSSQEEARSHLEVNKQSELKIESDKLRAVTYADAQGKIAEKNAVQLKQHDIATAKQDAVLLVEQQRAKAAEAKAQLQVLEQEVAMARLERQKVVHTSADAGLYRAKVDADGVRATATAEAERVRLIGEAEANAIRARGMAEVHVLKERNRAWEEVGNYGAILEKLIEVLPKVAEAMARPLAQTDKMVFVGSGSGGGGPSQLTGEMNRMMAEVPETVRALTGFDVTAALQNLASNGTASSAIVQGAAEGAATGVVDHVMGRHSASATARPK